MTPQEKVVEKRNSFRCSVSESRQEAVLQAGNVRMPVRLLDESAGGFAILTEGRPGVKLNSVARLGAGGAWCEVRVTNIVQLEPPETAEETAAEASAAAYRLGLCRLREVDPPEEEQGRSIRGSLRLQVARFFHVLPASGTLSVLGIGFAVVVVVVPLFVLVLMSHSDHPLFREFLRWEDRLTGSSAPPDGNRRQQLQTPSPPPRASQNPAAGPSPNPMRDRQAATPAEPAGVDELHQMVRRLPGATAFTLPDVIRRLNLSPAQQEQIRRIVETTVRLLQDLDVRILGSDRQQVSRQRSAILDQAHREALDALSDEQRMQWKKLTEP